MREWVKKLSAMSRIDMEPERMDAVGSDLSVLAEYTHLLDSTAPMLESTATAEVEQLRADCARQHTEAGRSYRVRGGVRHD